MRFIGNIEAKIDEKGRLFLPAPFRKQITEERVIVCKDYFEDCLVLYPESVWKEESDELERGLDNWDVEGRMALRHYMGNLEVVTFDGSGRLLLPKRCLQLAGIQNQVRFIGINNKIEIWAKEVADKPFMDPQVFAATLGKIMKKKNNE
jgi:MraZ protein